MTHTKILAADLRRVDVEPLSRAVPSDAIDALPEAGGLIQHQNPGGNPELMITVCAAANAKSWP